MRIFFYTVWDFTEPETDGICKKILSEISTLKSYNYEVDYSYFKNGDFYVKNGEKEILLAKRNCIWNKLFANKRLVVYFEKNKYDVVYGRYACADWYFIKLLKTIKKNRSKLIIEIPTYPYDQEFNAGVKDQLFLKIDKIHRKKMKKYVDRIATYSDDASIFGIITIPIMNGMNFQKIKLSNSEWNESINIIGVSSMAKWHGYDRIIEGLVNYYREGGQRKVYLHLVGDGPEIKTYKMLIKKGKLEENVILYGKQYGKKLDEIYDKCNLAIEVLGGHRKNITKSSSLKSREYAAKGLPIISSIKIDIFNTSDYPFVYYTSGDDKPIDIERIISFYDNLRYTYEVKDMTKTIREYAMKRCDMKITMEPIKNFINENVKY